MTEEVYQSLQNILARHKKVKMEIVVDGYGSFLLLDKDDKPKVALHIENEMRWEMKKYKNLQYVMGHSDVGVTLNVYTHASFDRAAEQMARSLI